VEAPQVVEINDGETQGSCRRWLRRRHPEVASWSPISAGCVDSISAARAFARSRSD